MIDLILIILLIVSISKPEVLLPKKIKEKASEEQKSILAKNYRKIYGILIAMIETSALSRYLSDDMIIILIILIVVEFVLFFKLAIPSIKENKEITRELKNAN